MTRPHDAFLSHATRDKRTVERLARDLETHGVRVWLDKWDLVPGVPWQPALEDALATCPVTLVCLGGGEEGPWQAIELRAALELSARNDARRVVPIWLPDAPLDGPLPMFLQQRHGVDLRHDWEAGVASICRTILGGEPPRRPNTESAVCPYRGLEPFHEAHARWMFGREDDVQKLVAELRCGQHLLVLVGASGSGKSSLVQAGLVPAVRTGQLDGRLDWRVATLRPGTQPLHSLAKSLLVAFERKDDVALVPRLVDAFATDDGALRDQADLWLGDAPSSPRLLVVVDQLEEIYTEAERFPSAAHHRRAFLANLLTAATTTPHVLVVFALRADFLPRCLTDATLAPHLPAAVQFALTPLRREQVVDAVRRPALVVGCDVDTAVVDHLADAMTDNIGALPLLQHALREMWELRDHQSGLLSWGAYKEIGGLEGAIAHAADRALSDVVEALGAEGGDATRRLFGRLVHLGEGTGDTRRRAYPDELGDAPTLHRALEILTARRILVVVDGDHVEIAHEALLTRWSKLQEWLDLDRRHIRTRQEVALAAEAWERAGCSHDDLWRGGRLAHACEELAFEGLSTRERRFLETSKREQDWALAEHTALIERQLDLAQKLIGSRRRERWWFTVTLLALLATFALIWLLVLSHTIESDVLVVTEESRTLAVPPQGPPFGPFPALGRPTDSALQAPGTLMLSAPAPEERPRNLEDTLPPLTATRDASPGVAPPRAGAPLRTPPVRAKMR